MNAAAAVVLLGGLTLAGVSDVAAFELIREGNDPCNMDRNLRWDPPRIRIDSDALGERERALAAEAVDAWRDVLGSRFQFQTGSGRVCNADDGVTTLAFTNVDCLGSPFGPEVLAITVSTWQGDRLVDADISFNPDGRLTTAQFRDVAMHEIGHVIGLDHSDACDGDGAGTLMNSRLVEIFGAPQPDDVDGARFIYSGGGDIGVPDGANGCAVGPLAAPLAAPLGGAGVVLALLAWPRRRGPRRRRNQLLR